LKHEKASSLRPYASITGILWFKSQSFSWHLAVRAPAGGRRSPLGVPPVLSTAPNRGPGPPDRTAISPASLIAGPLRNQALLKFIHSTKHCERHLPRGAHVHLRRQGHKVDPKGVVRVQGVKQVRHRSREAVEPPNQRQSKRVRLALLSLARRTNREDGSRKGRTITRG
jgi:hypothetical protein